MMDYEIYMFDTTEESEHLRIKDLIVSYDYEYCRMALDNYYSDYDCKVISERLQAYATNRELEYLMKKYHYSFQQAIDKLIDLKILRMW